MNHAGLETSEERTLKKIDSSQVKKREGKSIGKEKQSKVRNHIKQSE